MNTIHSAGNTGTIQSVGTASHYEFPVNVFPDDLQSYITQLHTHKNMPIDFTATAISLSSHMMKTSSYKSNNCLPCGIT